MVIDGHHPGGELLQLSVAAVSNPRRDAGGRLVVPEITRGPRG